MDPKIEELREWGCDIQGAMARMLDDEEFYLECLQTIPEDENFAGLEAALASGETAKAFDCAHSLKGVLGNLGLTPMYDQIVEIVEPLRAGHSEGLTDKLANLMKMRTRLAEILAR